MLRPLTRGQRSHGCRSRESSAHCAPSPANLRSQLVSSFLRWSGQLGLRSNLGPKSSHFWQKLSPMVAPNTSDFHPEISPAARAAVWHRKDSGPQRSTAKLSERPFTVCTVRRLECGGVAPAEFSPVRMLAAFCVAFLRWPPPRVRLLSPRKQARFAARRVRLAFCTKASPPVKALSICYRMCST